MEKKQKMNCNQINAYDLVTYLSKLGFEPQKIRGINFWYLSPFRDERTPSFKVNRNKNKWYDFGEGKGGSLIDFAIRFRDCTVGEFIALFNADELPFVASVPSDARNLHNDPKIEVLHTRSIFSTALLNYLSSRRIPITIADQYLKEVTYTNAGKTFYALGFQTDKGGYELRSSCFKGSSSPKYYTTFINGFPTLCVFEGVMDFLSFLTILKASSMPKDYDFLILNSLSFVSASIDLISNYPHVHLYLDNNMAGDKHTQEIMELFNHVEDKRGLYKKHEDLNLFLCYPGMPPNFKKLSLNL